MERCEPQVGWQPTRAGAVTPSITCWQSVLHSLHSYVPWCPSSLVTAVVRSLRAALGCHCRQMSG
jgi:hypothetical protein